MQTRLSSLETLWAQALQSNFRHTLQQAATWSGIAVHSGQTTQVTVLPSYPQRKQDLGVMFCAYPLSEWSVSQSEYMTVLSHPKVGSKAMSEHLFSALYCAGIDDVIIEVSGEELPILDGSALEYIQRLRPTPTFFSRSNQAIPRTFFNLSTGHKQPKFEWLEASIQVVSASNIVANPLAIPLQIDIEFEQAPLARQQLSLSYAHTLYKEVIPAKTFGFLADEAQLRQAGLIKGVSLENTRVYDQHGQMINPNLNQTQPTNEAAAHKVLDLLGDFYRLPFRLKGQLKVNRGGHGMNQQYVDLLLKQYQSI